MLFCIDFQTCSQLIKTSLKLSLEMKRKMSTSDSSSVDTSISKKIKQDLDSSDDEMLVRPSRSGRVSILFIFHPKKIGNLHSKQNTNGNS